MTFSILYIKYCFDDGKSFPSAYTDKWIDGLLIERLFSSFAVMNYCLKYKKFPHPN